MSRLTVWARFEEMEHILAFVDSELEQIGGSSKMKAQIHIAIDEIFANIVHYAYPFSAGQVTIEYEYLEEEGLISLCFIDNGIIYNSLEIKEPDITLNAEEREIGGLGFYMVKKTMDNVYYEYKDGKNKLTIMKGLDKK